MQSQAGPPTDGPAWPLEGGGGALRRFLGSALAGILTLVFAWQILLDVEEGARTEPRTSAAGRGGSATGSTVTTSIDQPGVGGVDPVTHDNNAAARRVPPAQPSQLGSAGRPSLTGNWKLSSGRVPIDHQSATDTLPAMPSRNCRVGEGNHESACLPHGATPPNWNHKLPPLVTSRRSATTIDGVTSPETPMSGGGAEREVPSFRRRPLMWSSSSGSDEQPTSPCSWNSEDTNFFQALVAHDSEVEGDDDDDDDDDGDRKSVEDTDRLPEGASPTWISLFRTFFMGAAAGQQQQRPASALPTAVPVSRRLQDRDVDDLLNSTLSTITEEGADELARKMSELDDDLDDTERTAWKHETDDKRNSCSVFEDDDDDDDAFYSDSYRYADDAVR